MKFPNDSVRWNETRNSKESFLSEADLEGVSIESHGLLLSWLCNVLAFHGEMKTQSELQVDSGRRGKRRWVRLWYQIG